MSAQPHKWKIHFKIHPHIHPSVLSKFWLFYNTDLLQLMVAFFYSKESKLAWQKFTLSFTNRLAIEIKKY